MNNDFRHISNGAVIPTGSYSDQPYIIKTDDGRWLCCVTTGNGAEGHPGQHIISMRSSDRGQTWSTPVDVESSSGPEASYSVLLKTPTGRIYIFYNYNTDNLRRFKADNPPYTSGWCDRVDCVGQFVFKFSDDHGQSWSEKRFPIDVRLFEIDRRNVYGGELCFFWNVGKAFVLDGAAYVSLYKVGGIGEGFFTSSEGVLLKSGNLMTESTPEKITWETLPDGEKGLRSPEGGGPISEEHSYSVMEDGSIYCVYRTVDGHPVETYSRDGGHSWEKSRYKRFADGRLMKHPRAANFAWKMENGKYLYWFHNHGGKNYEDRNPVWLCAGVERDGPEGRVIAWSQPEIFLYEDDPFIRMSYPDLIEEDGLVYISETQKSVARIHLVDPSFLNKLLCQFEVCGTEKSGLVIYKEIADAKDEINVEFPDFIVRNWHSDDVRLLDCRAGVTMDFWACKDSLNPGQILLENKTHDGRGFELSVGTNGQLLLAMHDGQTTCLACSEKLDSQPEWSHICVVIDGGPKIVSFVVNGRFYDGGEERQFGWSRFSPYLKDIKGSGILRPHQTLKQLKIYHRALMTTEAVGNYRAGHETK